MANRSFKPTQAVAQAVTHIFAEVTIGSSGAPTLVTADSAGVKSIARNSTGNYTLTLGTVGGDDDVYSKFLFFNGIFIVDGDTEQDLIYQVDAETISAGGSTIEFETITGANPTDPASGAVMKLHVIVKNSSYSF
jgi:hypothetical protein|tara:strand:- start:392 stop:796 length:405 start_codon:yes stop_codon:yes gene_type:complete